MSGVALLTVGRLPPALDVARALAAAGWRVIVAESANTHLARMSRAVDLCLTVPSPHAAPAAYANALLRIVEEQGVDLVIPVSEETPYVAGLAAQLPPAVRVYAPSQDRLLELSDKWRFNRLAGRLGLAVPESALCGTPEAAALATITAFVAKPRFGCSGQGVRFARAGEAPPVATGDLVQARLYGDAVSSFAIAREGRVLVNVVYRGAVNFGSAAVCFERVDGDAAVTDWVNRFIEGTEHSGFIAFDFIRDDRGEPRAIECNPRATSGLHFLRREFVADCLLDRSPSGKPLRDERLLAESYSCYTAALAALPRGREFLRRLRLLAKSRDVTAAGDDPWPFRLMMVNTWPIIWRALKARVPFAEVAVRDLQWPASGWEDGSDRN